MILALLLAAGAGTSAVEAERQFAADAQKLGQWTAFRKWSTPDALMFTPQPTNTHAFLKDRKDPPTSVFWWPGRSYISCDGNTAVNTGPWVREWGRSVGYFTTVWHRQSDGSWKWLLDHGDQLTAPRPEGGDIKARQASCSGRPLHPEVLVAVDSPGSKEGEGGSKDGTIFWSWVVHPTGKRTFIVQLWNGEKFDTVIEDEVKGE